MIALIIFIILFVALVAALIFSRSFRGWLSNSLQALGLLIVYYFPALSAGVRNTITYLSGLSGVYAVIIGIVSVVSLLLVIFALIFSATTFSGIAFLIALLLILITWLPAGFILRVFRVNSAVIPKTLKAFVAWVAFLGFLNLVFPDLLAFKTLVGASLVALIFLGVVVKINAIDKVIFPLVVLMCLTLAWQKYFPEDFRSSVRYAQSWSKSINSSKDRGSINNEIDAATTYGIILRDISILYNQNLTENAISLKRATIVRIVSHKNEIKIIDGQGFIDIQLSKKNGSFVNGSKYLIEAEFVQIASPRDIVPEDDGLLPKSKVNLLSSQPVSVRVISFRSGIHSLQLQAGETVRLMTTPSKDGCGLLSMSSQTYAYQYKFDGKNWENDGPTVGYPYMRYPTCLLRSQNGDILTIKVL